MSEISKKRTEKSRKFDPVKKFGVKKKRWEVENEEVLALQARLQDLDNVRSHAVLSDIRVVSGMANTLPVPADSPAPLKTTDYGIYMLHFFSKYIQLI